MHIQIINFNLSGISRSEYEAAAAEAAQPISEMPGLISKRWLANEETNTYGGVYFWETKQHMQDWMDSQIFKDIGANPAFANAKITDFEMIESLSAITRQCQSSRCEALSILPILGPAHHERQLRLATDAATIL